MFDQLFRSKKFIVLAIGVAAAYLSQRMGLSEEKLTEGSTIIASFLVGQGISDMGKESAKVLEGVTVTTQSVLSELFASKKFRVMVIGLIVTFFSDKFGIPEDQVATIVNLLATYVLGQGLADYQKGAAQIQLQRGSE